MARGKSPQKTAQNNWLILMHFLTLMGFILPFFNVVLTFLIWVHKREDHITYDVHGRAVLNFQLSMSIVLVIAAIALLTMETFGLLLFSLAILFIFAVTLFNIVTVILSGTFFYPLSYPFFKK